MHNRDKSGALASLSSVAKLPYQSCMDGISNTFCLLPQALGDPDDRAQNLATVLDGYFMKNAHHINVNILQREILEDAHRHPEKYPNLTIRVSGYAVRFNRLTPEQREEVMARTMHSGSVAAYSNVNPSLQVARNLQEEQPDQESICDTTSVDFEIGDNTNDFGRACAQSKTALPVSKTASSTRLTTRWPTHPFLKKSTTASQRLSPLHATTAAAAVEESLAVTEDKSVDALERAFLLDAVPETVNGAVHSIETFSTNDGPGIRNIVFLQGCSKRCIYCSNPETQMCVNPDEHPELAMTDEEVADLLKKYDMFLRPNGGGITMSGGEPLVQPEFVRAVFRRVKDMGLTTCIDTSGHGTPSSWDRVLPFTDHVMLCLKAMDLDLATKISGAPRDANVRAREFARHIRDNYDNIKVSLRWVLLKGMTDTDEELRALAEFAKELSPVMTHVQILPYHELGREKYDFLGRPYALDGMEPYPYEDAVKVKDTLEKYGVSAVLAKP